MKGGEIKKVFKHRSLRKQRRLVSLILLAFLYIYLNYWNLSTTRVKLIPEPTYSKNQVAFTNRSLIIKSRPTLILSGSIHYPRSPVSHWSHLMKLAKRNNLNTIETYVFWNLHEPQEGVYDFENDNKNLNLFIQKASEQGLYVIIRIGPYVCAEWNAGGFPNWLFTKEQIHLRTYQDKFYLKSMERFVKKTVEIIRPFLAINGGPVILLQVENEYGNLEWEQRKAGEQVWQDAQDYSYWCANLAHSLNAGVPWFMCQQGNVPTLTNTCNGFYCDGWIDGTAKDWIVGGGTKRLLDDHPLFFTELWTGWFQKFHEAKPTRPVTDLAFSTARWIAKGGSLVNYYMMHGGTNYGRQSSGGPFIASSYDYDAPITEFGFENIMNGNVAGLVSDDKVVGKFEHLAQLHGFLLGAEKIILAGWPQLFRNGSGEIFYYSVMNSSVYFLCNPTTDQSIQMTVEKKSYSIPPWSVLMLHFEASKLVAQFATNELNPDIVPSSRVVASSVVARRDPYTSDLRLKLSTQVQGIEWAQEPIFGIHQAFNNSKVIKALNPIGQMDLTKDESDYCWYFTEFENNSDQAELFIKKARDVFDVYIDGKLYKAGETTSNFKLKLNNMNQKPHNLTIFTRSVGLTNYGFRYEKELVDGILGDVSVNGQPLQEWQHYPGLVHESLDNTIWHNNNVPINKPLIWYRYRIDKQSIFGLIPAGERGHKTMAIYLKGFTKGLFYINGNLVGRYWLKKPKATCTSCKNFKGTFNPKNCLLRCDKVGQEYYHVPLELFQSENWTEIVILEEIGANPSLLEIVALVEGQSK